MASLKKVSISLLIIGFLIISLIPGNFDALADSSPQLFQNPDSLDKQIIFNGRAWRNIYSRIQGDQFLFSSEFMPGSVTIEDKLYPDLKLKYDIFRDELLTINDHGIIIQLNKEMIAGFNIDYPGKRYNFMRFDPDSVNNLSGFVRVLYGGKTSLYLKYKKDILVLAVDNKYDLFDQTQKIYLKKEGKIFLVNSKRDIMNLLKDKKQQLKTYIKTDKIQVSRQNPESFAPVVEYYDKLLH